MFLRYHFSPLVTCPTRAAPNHTVALGESLLSIARSYDMTVDEVYSVNVDLIDSQGVKPNMVLALPRVGEWVSLVLMCWRGRAERAALALALAL